MIGQIIALAIFVVMFGTTISEKIGRCIKMAMLQWKCTFYVNGRRTEQIEWNRADAELDVDNRTGRE